MDDKVTSVALGHFMIILSLAFIWLSASIRLIFASVVYKGRAQLTFCVVHGNFITFAATHQ